jgi:hypothetical protein
VNQIRKRLTYANVMSTIAVFLVLGGATAFAASQLGKHSVGTRQLKGNAVTAAKIKKDAVTSAKIKKGAVTGAKIKLSTVGTVPSAASAADANTVGGQTVTKVYKTLAAGAVNVPVASVAGFTMTASCEAGNVDVTLASPTGPGWVLLSGGTAGGKTNQTTEDYSAGAPGEIGSIRLDELSEGKAFANFGIASIYGATSTGTALSGVIGYDFQTFNSSPPGTCLVAGHLTSG